MQSLVPSTAAAGGSAVSPGSTHFTAAAAHRAPAHDAGAAAAAAAAQQSKLKAQKKRHAELLAAALTPPPQRDQAQVEALCDWLTTSHLLHALQPTAIRSLAQAMTTQAFAPGEVIYRQGEAARHLFILLSGMVCMFESGAGTPADAAASRAGSPPAHAHHQRAGFSAGGSRAQHSSGSARHHRSIRSGPGSRAGTAAGASSSSSSSSTGADSSTAAAVAAQQAEVRRVWPKEAFGEDDVTDRCVREQTAVAGTATAATFKQHSTSSSSGDGGGGGGGGGASGGPASQPGDATTSSSGGSGGGQAAAALTAAAAVAGADLSSHAVVLMLSADDYGAALQGRMSSLLEEKVAFLTELPAMRGLSNAYLKSLSHCFHQVRFEAREVLVRQGDEADCMFVIKTGQVCVLIDPSLTLTEASSSGEDRASSAGQLSGQAVDVKKLVQVCLLGAGAVIGDMLTLHEASGSPPHRSATVVALTELLTFKVPLREFLRRMPADVLEGMREVAAHKAAMNEHKAQARGGATGKDGHVMLGGAMLPESVLQGRGLRALWEAQQQGAAPVGGLLKALELYFNPDAAAKGTRGTAKVGSGTAGSKQRRSPAAGAAFVTGAKAAQQVESLNRAGFLAAPPQAFLALITDWRSARTNTNAPPQQVPPAWLFPLPLPAEQHKHAAAAAAAAAHTASLKLPASAEPLPQGPSQPPQRQQLLTSPTSLLAALQRDQFFTGSAPCSRPATPSLVAAGSAAVSSSSCTGASKLGAAAVAKEATLQLLALHLPQGSSLYSDPGSPVSARARGGGSRGLLHRAPLLAAGAISPQVKEGAAGCKELPPSEPGLAEATLKAASLFRPGSPISISRCGSPRPQSASSGSYRRMAAGKLPPAAVVSPETRAVLAGLGIAAAVVQDRGETGHGVLTFHEC